MHTKQWSRVKISDGFAAKEGKVTECDRDRL
jgi:hypothetical protein